MLPTTTTQKTADVALARNQDVIPIRPVTGWSVSKMFVSTGLGASGACWTLIELAEHLFGWKILAGSGAVGALSLSLGGVLVSSAVVIVYLFRTARVTQLSRLPDATDRRLADTLLEGLQAAYDANNWQEVIKIGSVLSRPLWLTGRYQLRIEVGKLVEAAAAFAHDYETQARALIDDLGWTWVVLDNIDEATQHITHGISIAQRCTSSYLIYKGHRHLSGIALNANNLGEAATHQQNAELAAAEIPDEGLRREAQAGLALNRALLKMMARQWQEALDAIEESTKIYRDLGDQERIVKLYHFKGDAMYELGRLAEAKDIYREGRLLHEHPPARTAC